MAQKKLRSAIWFFHDDYAGEELLYSKWACIICSMLCISHKNVGQCSVCIILYTWGGGKILEDGFGVLQPHRHEVNRFDTVWL